jgi:hypothetical protein
MFPLQIRLIRINPRLPYLNQKLSPNIEMAGFHTPTWLRMINDKTRKAHWKVGFTQQFAPATGQLAQALRIHWQALRGTACALSRA